MSRYLGIPDVQVCSHCNGPFAVCRDDACVSYAIQEGYIADYGEWKHLQRQLAQGEPARARDAAGRIVVYCHYSQSNGDNAATPVTPGL